MKQFITLLLAVVFYANAAQADGLTLGKDTAPVTIDEYASLTCPHCAVFTTQILPQLKKDFIDTGKVKLTFHHFPLDKASTDAAAVVQCLPPVRQAPMVELLYSEQANWAHDEHYMDKLLNYGALAGMDKAALTTCADSKTTRDAVLQARLDAEKAQKIQSTPSFIFNGGKARIEGAQPYDKFAETIKGLK